jgi:hypothetical protein
MVLRPFSAFVAALSRIRIRRRSKEPRKTEHFCTLEALAFTAPLGELDLAMRNRKTWIDDLWGTSAPVAVLFDEQIYPDRRLDGTKLLDLVSVIRSVPSIKAVFIDETWMGAEDIEKLRKTIPGVEVHYERRTSHTR